VLAVFDIDGVVADVRHRLHHIEGHRNWRAFFAAARGDALLPEGARLVSDLARQHDIVWLTGRPDWLRDVTTAWLTKHGLPADELHLRPAGDFRPAVRYKLQRLHELAARDIAAFIDDDEVVVDAAVRAGFPAVLADWMPRSGALRDAQERTGRT
jgi:uncharacterized HAD superfamily protein